MRRRRQHLLQPTAAQGTLRSPTDTVFVSLAAALMKKSNVYCFPRSTSGEVNLSTGGIVSKAVHCEPLRDVD